MYSTGFHTASEIVKADQNHQESPSRRKSSVLLGPMQPVSILQPFGKPFPFGVGVIPEVQEQQEEHQAIQTNDVDKDWELVWTVLQEEVLANVTSHHHKLNLQDMWEGRSVKFDSCTVKMQLGRAVSFTGLLGLGIEFPPILVQRDQHKLCQYLN